MTSSPLADGSWEVPSGAEADGPVDLVTGAFSYTGKYLTRLLLKSGRQVRTLTRSQPLPEFESRVRARALQFGDYSELVECLTGVSTFYITYWVRFEHGSTTFARAVANTKTLFRAAAEAGVKRVVYVSIANPSKDSPLPYYSGKAELEGALAASGLSYGIVRPTIIFGDQDVLINNIAWVVRRFPLFAIPGDGKYGIQPIYVEDMARLLYDTARQPGNTTVDAVGPETYTFEGLVRLIAERCGRRPKFVHVPPMVSQTLAQAIGWMVGDVLLTRDEVRGLTQGLLVSHDPPTGVTKLSEWLEAHADSVGRRYHNELRRHFR